MPLDYIFQTIQYCRCGLSSDLFPGAFPPSYSYPGHFFLGLSSCHPLLDPLVPIISISWFSPLFFWKTEFNIFLRKNIQKAKHLRISRSKKTLIIWIGHSTSWQEKKKNPYFFKVMTPCFYYPYEEIQCNFDSWYLLCECFYFSSLDILRNFSWFLMFRKFSGMILVWVLCGRCCAVCLVTQSCLTLCDPMDCNPSGSSVHGIFQERILEWLAIFFSRRSSQPRGWTCVSCVGKLILLPLSHLRSPRPFKSRDSDWR